MDGWAAASQRQSRGAAAQAAAASASCVDHRQRCEPAVVPVIPVSLAVQLSVALVAAGLLVFAIASLQQLWKRQP